jgi:hypothetical protein
MRHLWPQLITIEVLLMVLSSHFVGIRATATAVLGSIAISLLVAIVIRLMEENE